MDDHRVVQLNVGGVCFTTSRSTLHMAPYFRALTCDEAAAIFIDRDPTHFRHVLNHLRGSTMTPSDSTSLMELRVEADFYGLVDYVESIDDALRHHPGSFEVTVAQIAQAVRRMRS